MLKRIILLVVIINLSSCKDDKKQVEITTNNDTEINQIKEEPTSKFTVIGWRSNIAWRANKVMDSYSGKITVNNGTMEMKGDNINKGTFNIDLNTLIVTNLKGEEKDELELLLKGKAKGKENVFFNINEYPNAKFEIIDSYVTNGSRYLSGDLTINGITEPVEDFVVNFEDFEGDNSKIWLISKDFIINRLTWGLNYHSKTIEEDLVDELIIRDEIKIRIKILFKKS